MHEYIFLLKNKKNRHHIVESFQDKSRIQDLEADFPQKRSLQILNKAYCITSDLILIYLINIDHLNFKYFVSTLHILRFGSLKFRI